MILKMILNVICNVKIFKSKREPREYDGKMKYSFRLYLEARISYLISLYYLKLYLINMISLIIQFIIEIEYYLLL
jgi:hypothetical protein